MAPDQILAQIQSIFRQELDNAKITLGIETTAPDVPGWDSLTHVQLISAIESFYKIRFSSREIFQWKNVGEMITSISVKSSASK